jgi:dTDP-4-amino-4,6-dideoxygalactose transaminase
MSLESDFVFLNLKSESKPVNRRPHKIAGIYNSAPERVAVCRPLLPKVAKVSAYLNQIDTSRRYTNHGSLVLELQSRLEEALKSVARVVLAASGTAALTGAILASAGRARPRRNLCLVPAYTFIGTISAIEQCGYEPHFVDVDPESWMLEPCHCLAHPLIDSVGLIIPVAPYGRPIEQAKWDDFNRQTNVPIVIDGAAAMEYLVASPELYLGNVPVAVSFHATKTFCTGEGGAVLCSKDDLSHSIVQCLNFGYDLDRVCRRPAINGKMSEYHAAVGLAELDDWHIKLSRYGLVADHYRHSFQTFEGNIHLAPSIASNYALLEARSISDALNTMQAFSQHGIAHRNWYGSGAHRHPYCAIFGRDEAPVTDSLAARLIGVPMSVDLTADDVQAVCDSAQGCGTVQRLRSTASFSRVSDLRRTPVIKMI